MAKKARKRIEEDATPAFQFPEFDEAGFIWKEYELTGATTIAGLLALVLGVGCWALTAAGIPWFVPLALGFVGVVGTYFLIAWARTGARHYTKGDWAGLIAFVFFGWLAIWFVLINIAPNVL
ncbi:MAG: hypothetical protein L3K10_02320 [Thermoplasmata archaeon]|nr:hypothetical protein [Thermoplasmata archaeon]